MAQFTDTYQRITDTVIAQLEAGTKPWIKPWRGTAGLSVPRRATGEAYRGINVIMLWISSQLAGYDAETWMTYQQAQELGGQVRKGEKATLVMPLPHVERFVASTGAVIRYGRVDACYRPEQDVIDMPDQQSFLDEVHLYPTLLHEVGHWTAAPGRCDRDLPAALETHPTPWKNLFGE